MAEWLGTALQKLIQRFESASDLPIEIASNPVRLLAIFLCPFGKRLSAVRVSTIFAKPVVNCIPI